MSCGFVVRLLTRELSLMRTDKGCQGGQTGRAPVRRAFVRAGPHQCLAGHLRRMAALAKREGEGGRGGYGGTVHTGGNGKGRGPRRVWGVLYTHTMAMGRGPRRVWGYCTHMYSNGKGATAGYGGAVHTYRGQWEGGQACATRTQHKPNAIHVLVWGRVWGYSNGHTCMGPCIHACMGPGMRPRVHGAAPGAAARCSCTRTWSRRAPVYAQGSFVSAKSCLVVPKQKACSPS